MAGPGERAPVQPTDGFSHSPSGRSIGSSASCSCSSALLPSLPSRLSSYARISGNLTKKSFHLRAKRRRDRRLWAGTTAPPQPLVSHASSGDSLLPGLEGSTAQAGRLLERWVAARAGHCEPGPFEHDRWILHESEPLLACYATRALPPLSRRSCRPASPAARPAGEERGGEAR